jgi:trk system potassium uptake protein TrkA
VADVSNEETIKELNVSKFDCIFLGMSSVLDKQILALTYLKQEGAKKVIAKAKTDIQESILYRLGANQVIQPEQDVAERLARRLAFDNISDLIEFRGFALAEVKVPASLNGKSLMELNLRKTHQITILLIRKKNSVIDEPTGPDTILSVGDSLTVFGSQYQIEDLFKEN